MPMRQLMVNVMLRTRTQNLRHHGNARHWHRRWCHIAWQTVSWSPFCRRRDWAHQDIHGQQKTLYLANSGTAGNFMVPDGGLQATGWELLAGINETQSTLAPMKRQAHYSNIIDCGKRRRHYRQESAEALSRTHCLRHGGASATVSTQTALSIFRRHEQIVDLKMLKDLLADRTLPRVAEKTGDLSVMSLAKQPDLLVAGQIVLGRSHGESKEVSMCHRVGVKSVRTSNARSENPLFTWR